MNRTENDRIAELFERLDYDDFLEFERIPEKDRLHSIPLLCGLLKIATMLRDPGNFPCAAEHDEFILADLEELVPLTEEDVQYLSRCGISFSRKNGYFRCYV